MRKLFKRRPRQSFVATRTTKRRLRLRLFPRDPFGHIIFFKRVLMGVVGALTYARYNIINRTKVVGVEHLHRLPSQNVMFISNHQTYFADVIAMFHIFCGVKWRFKNINFPIYLLLPRVKSYYVAAEETMKKGGMLPKVLAYAGAVTIKRSWRSAGQDVERGVDKQAPDKIRRALEDGWVVNFPQGTTRAGAPVRRGAASLIKQLNPIVVPVEINGFRRAFDKKGFFLKKRGTQLTITFYAPVQFPPDASVDEIYDFLQAHVLRQAHGRQATSQS
ncbi:MAG: lysophospholipid acyltransferase family protein [Bernardetiaceae bacterium]